MEIIKNVTTIKQKKSSPKAAFKFHALRERILLEFTKCPLRPRLERSS